MVRQMKKVTVELYLKATEGFVQRYGKFGWQTVPDSDRRNLE